MANSTEKVFGGGASMSSGPSKTPESPTKTEGHPKAYGGSQTISNLRDGSSKADGQGTKPSAYGMSGADGAFVRDKIQRKAKGSGDRTGAGHIASESSLGH